jgi:replicative DNA helicase
MAMAQLPGVSYRPSMGKETLVKIVINQFHQKNLNNFIDEAVKERIVRLMHRENEIEKLGLDVGKFLFERSGWKVSEPGPKLNKTLDEEIKKIKSGKAKYKKFDL